MKWVSAGLSSVFALAVLTTGCLGVPQPRLCAVMQLDIKETVHVLASDGRSRFKTECDPPTPSELLIDGDSYGLFVLLRASDDPDFVVGVTPNPSGRFEISGEKFQKIGSGSALDARATHLVRFGELADMEPGTVTATTLRYAAQGNYRPVRFSVLDRTTGKVVVHTYPFKVATCTCKEYDGS